MKKVILGITILALIFFCLGGFSRIILMWLFKSRPDTDVTSSPEYNFATFAGTVSKTKVRTALADVKLYTGKHVSYVLHPNTFDPTDPNYTPAVDTTVIAVLPVGTRLRIERLMKDNGPGSILFVIGSLEDGKIVYLSDYLLAKNRFTFPGSSDSRDWGVNPDVLEKAE